MKKLSSVLLSMLLLFSCSSICFASRTPSSCTPVNGVYYIYTPEHLNWVAYQLESGFDFYGYEVRLMNNLDFRGPGFRPIGTYDTNFNGRFSGNHYTIDYANVDLNDAYVGIFRYIGPYGEVRNLTIGRHCYIRGNSCVGGIAGFNAGKIVHCCNKAFVYGNIACCASLVGYNDTSGYVHDCQAAVWSLDYLDYPDSGFYVGRNLGVCTNCADFYLFPW